MRWYILHGTFATLPRVNYLYEDLDSSCGSTTGTLEYVSESTFFYSFLNLRKY